MKTIVPDWLIVAMQEIGESEFPGPACNPRIAEYLETVGMSADDEISWCSAFMNWCMTKTMKAGTGSAAARSWATWGEKLESIRFGCVAVFERGTEAWQGHVGLALQEIGENVLLLGGNQGDTVKFILYPKSRLISYRWPTN